MCIYIYIYIYTYYIDSLSMSRTNTSPLASIFCHTRNTPNPDQGY